MLGLSMRALRAMILGLLMSLKVFCLFMLGGLWIWTMSRDAARARQELRRSNAAVPHRNRYREAKAGLITPGGNPVCLVCGDWYGPPWRHDCEVDDAGEPPEERCNGQD
ncbi:hypothetical protein CG716_05180 [Mycolicibacterium sphagni]|uniref:Uncharacterized protein n=1 Tax=Mycolicibacterium sphagni TaxID=1786 RepID=A0A255DQS1_9MYCO|nr:hypothetical protein CG716_05180 [Mycolicibacterium sphagni]